MIARAGWLVARLLADPVLQASACLTAAILLSLHMAGAL